MPIEYLQIVSVPVSSQDRAMEFYVNGLGWDLLSDEAYELGSGQRQRWLEVRPPGGQTAISLVLEDSSLKAGSVKGMILRAAALESTVAELAGRGDPGNAMGEIHEFPGSPAPLSHLVRPVPPQ